MSVNFLELIAGTRVDLNGLEEGMRKGEDAAISWGKSIGVKMTTEPTIALKNLGRLSVEELQKMAAATNLQAEATKRAYSAHQASATAAKTALEQQLRVLNELIARQTAYTASLKAGTAQQIEANAALTEMKLKAAALSTELKAVGNSMTLVFGVVTAIAGAALLALEKAIHKTAEYGLEMEHLSNRMGMSVKEAATLVGIMERFGVNANMGARAMQMLSQQVHQTQNSLDPLSTKLGKVLGGLRDTSGHALNMSQVLDLVRQKVSGASTDTERLQIATGLLGSRIGGQLVPMLKLGNEEWERQKASVEATLGPIDKAAELALQYKQATAELDQTFRGLQVTMGTQLLPTIIDLTHSMTALIAAFGDFKEKHPTITELIKPWKALEVAIDGVIKAHVYAAEKFGLVDKGTYDAYTHMDEYKEAARKAALETDKTAEAAKELDTEIEKTIQNERKLAAEVTQRVKLLEKARSFGIDTGTDDKMDLEMALNKLTEQRLFLEEQIRAAKAEPEKGGDEGAAEKLELQKALGKNAEDRLAVENRIKTALPQERLELEKELTKLAGDRAEIEKKISGATKITADQLIKYENELIKNKIDGAQLVSEAVMKGYKQEELQLKANGAFNLSSEIALLQKKLADEHIVGDERLKIEAEVYQKRKQFTEDAIKLGRQLGFVSADDEINYRKQRMAELLGKGDVIGASQELVKARDLAIKQADQVMEFTKKIRVVALQDEITYQRNKLALVKGNAEEEMKILTHIADLDKQLYDRRLKYALDYNQSAIDSYRAMLKATGQTDTTIGGPKESKTFGERQKDAERARFQSARLVEQVAMHGGTDEEIATARKVAEDNRKEIEEAQALGKSASEGMKALADAGKDFFRAASGGEEVRAPGGASPIIGSLLSPAEGLATSALARGSDVPRLDTSFTDLAIRVRDVLNATISPLQNFASQLTLVTRQMASLVGTPYPGGVGPSGGTTIVPYGTPPPTGFGQASGPTSLPPTSGPGTAQPPQPTAQTGVGSITGGNDKTNAILDALHQLPEKLQVVLLGQNAANAESLQNAINSVLSQRQEGVNVQVSVDANTGDLLINKIVQELSSP